MRGRIIWVEITPDIFQGYDRSVPSETGKVSIEMQVDDTVEANAFTKAMASGKKVIVIINEE